MNRTVWVVCIDKIPCYVANTKENAIATLRINFFNRLYSKKIQTKIIKALDNDEFYNGFCDGLHGNYAIYEVVNMI